MPTVNDVFTNIEHSLVYSFPFDLLYLNRGDSKSATQAHT